MSFNRALLYTGHVWHQRLLPRKHNFRYPFWWLAIPLQEWDGQPKKMPFGLSWHPKNHGPRNGSPVLPWLIEKTIYQKLARLFYIRNLVYLAMYLILLAFILFITHGLS